MASPFVGDPPCEDDRASKLCPLCRGQIADPRLLTCLHTFCRACIEQMAVTAGDSSDINCPLCRVTCHLPVEGAIGLPQDRTVLPKQTFAQRRVAVNADESDCLDAACAVEQCEDHHEPMVFLCDFCELPVCGKCATVGDHIGHAVIPYDDEALCRHRARILSNVESLRENVRPRMEVSLEDVKKVGERMGANAARAREDIKAATRRAIEQAKSCERELLSKLDDLENERLKVLEGQQEELQTTLGGLVRMLAFADRVGKVRETDMSQVRLLTALDKRILALEEADLRPRQHPRVLLRAPTAGALLKNSLANAGELLLCNAAASQCVVTITRDYRHVEQGGEVTVTIQAHDDEGERLTTGGDLISHKWDRLPPDTDGRPLEITVEVEDKGDGNYKLCCRPTNRGEHVMTLFVNEELVQRPLSFSYGNLLDPDECHPHIELSDNFGRATKVHGKTGYSSVLGRTRIDGYREYSWVVELGESSWYAVGLVSKPVHNKSYNMGQALCWSSQEYRYIVGHAPEKSQLSAWQGNEMLLLQTDGWCLRITNLQNQETDTIRLSGGPYYPYFNMNAPGSSIYLHP